VSILQNKSEVGGGNDRMKGSKVQIYPLPTKHFWKRRDKYAFEVEDMINQILRQKASNYNIQVLFDDFGDPTFLIVEMEEEIEKE
jgi:hypothetical protein